MANPGQNIVPEHSLDRDCTTLSRHVLQQFSSFTAEAQDISAIMSRLALAAKLVSRRLSRAGLLAGALGFTGETNVQGESVKKWIFMPTRYSSRYLSKVGWYVAWRQKRWKSLIIFPKIAL